jgi:TATA-binding protein-associated factor Taf7
MENINLDKIIKADEVDTNMILSVPEEIGIQLQKIIQGHASKSEKESLHIEIIENPSDSIELEESRKLIFKINDTLLPITILDLPCIIEAQKTIDYKNFYKSGDISQMMFVHDEEHQLQKEDCIINFDPFTSNDETFNKIVWKKDYDHRYKLRNGLGRGTKNIRSKRFKRKIRYNGEEILEVAKKLKMIIDNGAASFENQMKQEQSHKDEEDILKMTFLDNHSDQISQSEYTTGVPNVNSNINIVNKNTNKATGHNPTTQNTFNNFAIPHSKTPNNKKKNRGKVEKTGNTGGMNINISLGSIDNADNKNMSFTNQNINSKQPVLGSFKIPTNHEEEIDDMILESINPEEQKLIQEYSDLKEQYKTIKSQLETNDSKDSQKLKKKIKKRLKEIKAIFKKEINS